MSTRSTAEGLSDLAKAGAMDAAASSSDEVPSEKHFRPIVFLLNSHTPNNLDAPTVAHLLQPRFRKGDYYVVDLSTLANPMETPNEAKKTSATDAALHSGASPPQDRISALVQSALAKIAATRREAEQAALQAKITQLSALQADYIEDGLSAEEALAVAEAELQDGFDSEDDDDASVESSDSHFRSGGRLPPAVCVVNVPLSSTAVARLAENVDSLAAVVLLESQCSVRELVSASAAGRHNSSSVSTGTNAPNDRVKGRGPRTGAAVSSLSSAGKQQNLSATPGGSAEDVLGALGRAALAQPHGSAFQDVLLQHVSYPTEGANGAGASPQSPAIFRPSVPAAQFLSTLEALLLRIFSSWVRYDAWRAKRFLVPVPDYTPLLDSEAALSAVIVEDSMPAAAATEQRPSRGKNTSPGGREGSIPLSTSAEPPTTAPHPCTMAQVAAEQFEYRAYMQRWIGSVSHRSTDSALAAGEAVQACLQGCMCQVTSSHGSSTLRTSADTSAAQLGEDTADAWAKCRVAVAVSSGASLRPPKDSITVGYRDKGAAICGATPICALAAPAIPADSVEEALAHTVTAEVGSAVLPSVSTALVTTSGDGDALHWMYDALVARDQHGWHTALRTWERTALYCLHRHPGTSGAPRTQHTAHLLDCPTTFPRFFREEDFLASEGRHYAPSSLSDDTEEDDESDSLSEETASDSSRGETNSAAEDAATELEPPVIRELPPPRPTVDHVGIVGQHLRRRRVLEQVRLSHARPPVQELLGCATPCRAVVTETQWMRAVDGTVVEVARTAANSAQVRCAIIDARIHLQAGFMLECPSLAHDGTTKVTATDSRGNTPLPEPLVASAVLGFLSVGHQLRVMTEVVADNTQAFAQAAYTAVVAAAKDAALAQYEAQFRRVGKAPKSRDKATPATQLTLEQITETLLAALPPPPPSPHPQDGDRESAAVRTIMRVHVCFPLHDCVMTTTVSKAGVPGVYFRCLTPSQHSVHLTRRRLLFVHMWNNDRLSATALTHLQGIRVYLDGVVEVHSPDLACGVRLLLYTDGTYLTVSGECQLLVFPDGRFILYEGSESGRVVHKLQRGRVTTVTAPAVTAIAREDGVQLEMVEPDGTDDVEQASSTPSSRGRVCCVRFGEGVSVEQGEKGDKWSWRFAGVPTVFCDATAHEIAVAIDENECSRFAYLPRTNSFSLFVRDGGAEGMRVAADVAMNSGSIVVLPQGYDLPTAHEEQGSRTGVFAVDCAYGGVYGRVGTDHVYRVSPFGRCYEEVESGGAPQNRQLVLPQHYRRSKKMAEAVVVPEYASPSFRRIVTGEDDKLATVPTVEHAVPLHLQVAPLLPLREPSRMSASTAASPYNGLALPHPAVHAPLQVRCIALQENGTQFVVLDAASWMEWSSWWQQHSSNWVPHYSSTPSKGPPREGASEERAFRLIGASRAGQNFAPLTAAGTENAPAETSVVQDCVLLLPSREASSAPAWCSAGSLTPTSVVWGTAAADGEEDNTAAKVAVAQTAEPLDAAPLSSTVTQGDEQAPLARPTDSHLVSRLPATSDRRGGSLNYWSSSLCPQAVQFALNNSTTEDVSIIPTVRAHTASPSADVATSSAAVASSPTIPVAAPKKTFSSPPSRLPLMRSYYPAVGELTGTNASSRFHTPLLEAQPRQVNFGKVLPERRYLATVRLINISTVPCRYRVRVGAVMRPFLSVYYPHQFVAPGITTEVQVELCSGQPYGVVDSQLSVVHEGGAIEINVRWCTTDEAHTAQLGDGVMCVGWAYHKPVVQHPRMPARNAGQPNEASTLSVSDVALDMCTA
ncbi:Flagellarassociated PapDlike [Leishmania braziliensis]|nr:Flagellarassociated PapDlike [Leishmania braziliensis]